MPRSADLIAGKFMSFESHPSMRRNPPSPVREKVIFRKRVNSQGGHSPIRSSNSITPIGLNRRAISLLEAAKIAESMSSVETSPKKETVGSTPRASIVEVGDGEMELVVEKEGSIAVFDIVGQANVDGVRHLQEGSCLSRLTYVTGSRLQNRQPKPNDPGQLNDTNTTSVYEKVLANAWDMDAVKFLRNAAHWKSRMILRCTFPDGTKCRLSDFKAIWTLGGLCWAINTDPMDPIYATRGGSAHSLSLVLNIEKYERIESCTDTFRSTRLPGLKILIFNQTDIPVSSSDGVNVPPGFTMDIPFKVQHRRKFPGEECLSDDSDSDNFESDNNAHSCTLRKYLTEIEKQCECSMRRAYNPNLNEKVPFCNVRQYFNCVDLVLKSPNQTSFACKPSCDEVDVTAWQDLTLLPDNLLPRTLEQDDIEDEHEVIEKPEDEFDDFDEVDTEMERDDKLCNDHLIPAEVAVKVKRYAERAYEKRARYQDDMRVKTDKLIKRLKDASEKLVSLKYGWTNENYMNMYERISSSVQCFKSLRDNNTEIVTSLDNPPTPNEEKLAKEFHKMLDMAGALQDPEKYQDLKSLEKDFGHQFVTLFDLSKEMLSAIVQVWKLYKPDTYSPQLGKNLDRYDRILALIDQYENNRMKRRAWAEKMNSRNMRNFYDQEFNDVWYNPTLKDIDHTLVRKIHDLELDKLPQLYNASSNRTATEAGAVHFLSDMTDEKIEEFAVFMRELHDCSENELKNKSEEILKEFKKAFSEFQSAYTDLFRKELPEYLENFRYGERENFAVVNVFFHKLSQEHWVQDSTYSVWSLACDVGGALGLFLGASLLTLIELLYLCCQYGVFNRCCWDYLKKSRDKKKLSLTPSAV